MSSKASSSKDYDKAYQRLSQHMNPEKLVSRTKIFSLPSTSSNNKCATMLFVNMFVN